MPGSTRSKVSPVASHTVRSTSSRTFKRTGWPSKKLADGLLDDAGVAALSGTAFGDFSEGYLRVSVANSIENIEKALDRIDAWTKKNL
jgi:aspartate/methionine/tyrosine aminotransferase